MANPSAVGHSLDRLLLSRFPGDAAKILERSDAESSITMLSGYSAKVLAPVFEALSMETLDALLNLAPEQLGNELLCALSPARAAAVLYRFDETRREKHLSELPEAVAFELRALVSYPEDTAGRIMDPRIPSLQADQTVRSALSRLRRNDAIAIRYVFVVDEKQQPIGSVSLYSLLTAERNQPVKDLISGPVVTASALAPREELTDLIERSKATELPVVDFEGRYVGVIRAHSLMALVQENSAGAMLTMVGASPEERSLSPALLSVRKRLPWLQINLLTAFMAASVVALFESTIAKFTALAVLLPVVAGQSGNSGSQALAVTMRGLALREISFRHWPEVVGKEFRAGLINGLAIAIVCAIGVMIWSRSIGLAFVIAVSMVLAMVAAGCSGALIPILLRRFGQDPAAASSIILTTVTDIVGFFSFLGIATLLQNTL